MTASPAQVHPSEATIAFWTSNLIPELDLWYWNDSPIDVDLTGCQVVPREALSTHPTLSEIHYINAYCRWQRSPETHQILLADRGWVTRLHDDERFRVLAMQVELKRGLVYPRWQFDSIPPELERYVVGDTLVLGGSIWSELPDDLRRPFVLRESLAWDDHAYFPLPDDAPDHLQAMANTFIDDVHGANCLSTTAFCFTGEPQVLHRWMFQLEFGGLLERSGYRPSLTEPPETGDVVTFAQDGTIQHATFCVGPNRYLNKNGQTMFNPIKVVDQVMLDEVWADHDRVIYRRHAKALSPERLTT